MSTHLPSSPSEPRIPGGIAAGDLVAGKYRVEGVLGEGGMGVVLAARHEQLGTLVALKVMSTASAGDPVLVARFLREARAAAKIRSEHAARVLDVGTLPSGLPYMVLEYLEGADLSRVLRRDGRLPVPVACDYVLQACQAVAEAHGRGIVHRDLKPENLYLTTTTGGAPMVKVLDFGVSKVFGVFGTAEGSLTTTGVLVGSPVYMAPEQMRSSRTADPRSDVWALGVVLYELLTERCPFEAESLPDLCIKVDRDAPTSLRDLRAEIPATLAAVVERCLEKRPELRFADAAELAAAIEPFAGPASRGLGEGARAAMRSQVTTLGAAPTIPAPPERPAATTRVWTVAAVLLVAACAGWVVKRPQPTPRPALAAADAALSSAVLGEGLATLTALPPDVESSPARPGAAESPASSPPPPASARPTTARGPSRPSPPRPPVRAAADDDIPAFR